MSKVRATLKQPDAHSLTTDVFPCLFDAEELYDCMSRFLPYVSAKNKNIVSDLQAFYSDSDISPPWRVQLTHKQLAAIYCDSRAYIAYICLRDQHTDLTEQSYDSNELRVITLFIHLVTTAYRVDAILVFEEIQNE